MMIELTPFYEAVQDPAALARSLKDTTDARIIGTLCSYAPEELIHAAGCHPMRLFSSKADIQLAENHLQAYCCSLVRGILEDGLSGRLDFLDGTVFPHTCDSIQRLSDIWRLNTSFSFFADVIMPAKLTTDSARQYMTRVLEKFRADLAAYTGSPITDQDIAASIALFNRIRKSLGQIYQLKAEKPGIISSKDMFTLIKGAMIMDRGPLADLLESLVKKLEADQGTLPAPDKRVVLSGSVCDMPDLYSLIENAGAIVVGDDLCSGQRWFEGLVPEDLPPMEGLTARYTDRIVCPAKHMGNTARADAMIELVEETSADGVIFTLLKFCDPHAFDYPYVKEALDKAKIPSLHLEMDDTQDSAGQMATRLETFIHMI